MINSGGGGCGGDGGAAAAADDDEDILVRAEQVQDQLNADIVSLNVKSCMLVY
jgi:hypothetical protein